MSDTTALLSACHGKYSAASPDEARRLMKRMTSKRKSHGALNVYRCQFCGRWHFGSTLRRRA